MEQQGNAAHVLGDVVGKPGRVLAGDKSECLRAS